MLTQLGTSWKLNSQLLFVYGFTTVDQTIYDLDISCRPRTDLPVSHQETASIHL